MIIEIEAKFSCDDCGTEFFILIDPAYKPPSDWSMFDVAEDSIRGGHGYVDGHENKSGYVGMVEGDRHLCGNCAHKVCQSELETDLEQTPEVNGE